MRRLLFLVVATDLDDTLLDHATYSFAPAAPALARLRRERVPLILCSSKTRAEIEEVRRRLCVSDPFISENGGALFVPRGYFPFHLRGARRVDGYEAIEFGRPYDEVVHALHAAASALGIGVTGFSDMSDGDVARRCGLPLARARLARRREYDEPFAVDVSDRESIPLLHLRLTQRGLRCTAGARFDHVTGTTDKGRAVGVLRMLYRLARRRHIVTVGLGDALNDVSLLREVQIPIIVRQRESGRTEQLLAAVPSSRVSGCIGPQGWNEQVEAVMDEIGSVTCVKRFRISRCLPGSISGSRPASCCRTWSAVSPSCSPVSCSA